MEEKLVTAVVIGAGFRGSIYATYALVFPQKFRVIIYSVFSLLSAVVRLWHNFPISNAP